MGSSSVHDEEPEDIEEQPLVRHRGRNMSGGSVDAMKDIEEDEVSPHSSPQRQDDLNSPGVNSSNFHSDEVLYLESRISISDYIREWNIQAIG